MTSPITLVGNLTGDPELRFTPSGKAVANFTVAVNERVKNASTGEWEDGEGSFYNCSVWNDYAENVAESLERGMRVVVSGGLKTRSYDRQDGSKGTSVDVTVDEVGPSLRWATTKVSRRTNNNNGGGGQQRSNNGGQQQRPPADDPWASSSASSDEPPF